MELPRPIRVRPVDENGRLVRGLGLVELPAPPGAAAIGLAWAGQIRDPFPLPAQQMLFRADAGGVVLVELIASSTSGDLRLQWAGGHLVSAQAGGDELLEPAVTGATTGATTGVAIPAELAPYRLAYRGGDCPWLPEVAAALANDTKNDARALRDSGEHGCNERGC